MENCKKIWNYSERNIYKIFVFFFFIFSQTGFSQDHIRFAETRSPYKSVSPIISKLQESNSNSFPNELNKLWTKIKNEGSPLIEKDTLYDDYLYVTLIYQDSTENKDISFEIFGIYDEPRFGDMKLHRLKGTDLYYRCYMVPNDICFSYRFNVKDTLTGKSIRDTDKYNENRIPTGTNRNYSYSVLDLRQNEPDWNKKRYENTGSKVDTIVFDSKIMNNSRDVYVYLPSGYNQQQKLKYPVIYLFDSFIYLNRVEVPNILDNLIKEGKIKPMVAVMIDNPEGKRNIEMPLNFDFKQFVVDELVPFIRKEYNTSLNPNENIIGGISYGGGVAAFIAFYHEDIFGKVLSQSGSFWRDLELTDNYGNEVRADWLINRFLVEKNKDLKIFLDWGFQEDMVLGANRKFVRILDQLHYDFKFIEFNGWHDWSNSRKTFPVGLLYLLND
jgi:Enterochelin esterase and related enzymes